MRKRSWFYCLRPRSGWVPRHPSLSPRTRVKRRPRKTTARITAGSGYWGSQVLPACSVESGTTVWIAIATAEPSGSSH
jgi:hypothetical protein